ncbi:MAG: ABC transporter ATP-binding protein [Arthrobacter sp.]|jgi:putative ABC transport system ATP-binding protein|nr:ABC transporter ATP-binding protein [Arthrobacter sp.]
MTTPALLLENVQLALGDGDARVTALENVNLRVNTGEFVAIVGPSGSGKSSLLAVAGALSAPDAGRVRIAGQDVTRLSASKAARFRRENLGFVFQADNLTPSLTSAEQLTLAGKLAGRRRIPVAELLAAVDMSHRAGHRPGQLSGGERQRVGIARALALSPRLLLVDEPTAALDRARSHDVVKLLAERAAAGETAVVMVTHDREVLGYCDRVLEMVDGRLSEVEPSVR